VHHVVAITTRPLKGANASPTISVHERAVGFSGIEERDAAFDGRSNESNHLLLVSSWAVAKAYAHAAKPDSRDFKIISEFALLHCSLLD
jgi:hypothetical protein